MGFRLFVAAALLSVLATSPLLADVVHVGDYRTHEPTDRRVLFAFAVSPDQDVLSLVAKRDGKWRLTRIHGWLDKNPVDQSIDVPGWPISLKRPAADVAEFLEMLNIDLFVTGDGRYAICVAGAYWARNGQRGGRWDDLVSAVDLRNFEIVKTIRTSDLDQEAWQPYTSPAGRLALLAETFPPPAAGSNGIGQIMRNSTGADAEGPPPLRKKVRLMVLTVPDLTVEGQCRYSEAGRGDSWTAADDNGACGAMLGSVTDGPISLRDYIETLQDAYGFPVHRAAPAAPCPGSGTTRDGRFKKESCEKYHLSAWNRNVVIDESKENILSADSGELVGAIEETTHNSVNSHFAEQNGRDYVLVMEGGTKLKVYEIKP